METIQCGSLLIDLKEIRSGSYLVIYPDTRVIRFSEMPTLENLYRRMSCETVEIVANFGPFTAIVDEDGRSRELQPNFGAAAFLGVAKIREGKPGWRVPLVVGPVAVVWRADLG